MLLLVGLQLVDQYENPGPVQFYGPPSVKDSLPKTLSLETRDYLSDISALHSALDSIAEACRWVCQAAGRGRKVIVRGLASSSTYSDLVFSVLFTHHLTPLHRQTVVLYHRAARGHRQPHGPD